MKTKRARIAVADATIRVRFQFWGKTVLRRNAMNKKVTRVNPRGLKRSR
jgi:hypothetical protein